MAASSIDVWPWLGYFLFCWWPGLAVNYMVWGLFVHTALIASKEGRYGDCICGVRFCPNMDHVLCDHVHRDERLGCVVKVI